MEPAPHNAMNHEIRVTWGDCDPANIAYTARIPAFALDAINAWWEENFDGNGWYQLTNDLGVGTPFVRMEIDFKRPITPRHRLNCRVWPQRLGETSINFRVDGYQDEKLCFSGSFVCVFVISGEFRKQPPPPDIRAMLEKHLPNESSGS